jgi:hypothetical protein
MIPQIPAEVLGAIREAQAQFQLWGRPLPPAAVEDLAQEWRRARREFVRVGTVTAGYWPVVELQELCRDAPQSAIAVLEHILQLEPTSAEGLDILDEVRALLRHPAVLLPQLAHWLEKYPSLRRCFTVEDPDGAKE